MKYKLPFFYDYVFPNMVLPNALITEFGLVNYLHTLHSNRQNFNSFFEEQLGDQNPVTALFDTSLGTWPNSLRTNGTHMSAGCYWESLEYYEDSLFYGKKKTNKYIYPIKISPHIDDFIGYNLRHGSKLNGEYFWKHMSAEALADVHSGRAIVFLDYAQENYVDKHSYCNLHEVIKLSGIPKSQIILAFNSFNARELYESWFSPDERMLEVHNWPFVMTNSSFHYDYIEKSYLNPLEFTHSQHSHRDNYFLFKIKRPRNHRLALLYKMCTDGLLEKGDWSCITSPEFNEHQVNAIAAAYNFQIDVAKVQELYKKFPYPLKNERDIDLSTVSAWSDKNSDAHKNSYFYICTETFTNSEYKSLTEKVFKPIINFQPFLFVAYPGALKLLKELGFKTFDGFIDESYDDEPDESKRIHMIYSEITRLCSMSKEEIHNWFWSMKDILFHNNKHLLQLWKNEPIGAELIKYLHNRLV